MSINFKDLGIGAAVGGVVTAVATQSPKIAKAIKEKVKTAKTSRAIRRHNKNQNTDEPANPPEEK